MRQTVGYVCKHRAKLVSSRCFALQDLSLFFIYLFIFIYFLSGNQLLERDAEVIKLLMEVTLYFIYLV